MRLQSITKRPRLISPKIAHALESLPLTQRQKIQSDRRKRHVFRTLFLKLAGQEPLLEDTFQKAAGEAAKRVLDLDITQQKANIIRRTYARFFPHRSAIQFLSSQPISNQPLLLSSGARTQVNWMLDIPIIDSPLRYRARATGVRIIVKPVGMDPKQAKIVADSLRELKRSRDILDELSGAIGYFGIGFHRAREHLEESKRLVPIAIIWTWQQRGIPNLPNYLRKQYKNWDFELLRHVEATLKRMGIKIVAIPSELRTYQTNVRRAHEITKKKLKQKGYEETALESDDFKENDNQVTFPTRMFLIKRL